MTHRLRAFLTRFAGDDRGATALEYGLIVALIFLVILSSVTAFGHAASALIVKAANAISAAIS